MGRCDSVSHAERPSGPISRDGHPRVAPASLRELSGLGHGGDEEHCSTHFSSLCKWQ